MPITIKEILPSDSMSGVVEKINFNFDQLILAGGGPPGPQGPLGPAGTPGPIGTRGDHWFVGPSALGQTADHDGFSPLQIEDHFLDPIGDVWSYFDNGATGWTFSGINLRGATGPSGATGGSNEWNIYPALFGNPVSSIAYIPDSTPNPLGTLNPDFIIPKQAFKNNIFLGDFNWAYSSLQDFGSSSTIGDSTATPKLTIIQNEINNQPYGINGLAFGSPGLTSGNLGTNNAYVNTGATTSAQAFTYMGLYTDLAPSGDYFAKFGIRSYQLPIKIEVGRAGGANYWSPAPFDVLANNIRLTGYDTGAPIARIINMAAEQTSVMNASTVNGKIREISINSNLSFNGDYTDANTRWGYVALQNVEAGSNPPTTKETRFGSVVIGPTFSNPISSTSTTFSSASQLLGVDGWAALNIVRKITGDSVSSYADGLARNANGQIIRDSAISFLYPNYANDLDTDPRSAIVGKITPIRYFSDPGTSELLDCLVIGSGLISLDGTTNANDPQGRIGIQNSHNRLRKPQFPFHVSMEFIGTPFRANAWDGGYANTDIIQGWFAGFDSWQGQQRANGIGFGFKVWSDGVTSFAGSTGFTNPVIQSYYRTDNGQQNPNDGLGGTFNGITIGRNNPHLYMQIGPETLSGNLGIGLAPSTTLYSPGATVSQMSAPYSKVAIDGSVTVGGTSGGYHHMLAHRATKGLLIEGPIFQGATTIAGQFSTNVFGGQAILSTFGPIISIATDDLVFGRSFVSRGYNSLTPSPDYALPDTKTGMMQDPSPGFENVGYLVGNPDIYAPSPTLGPTNATVPTKIARFSARGEAGYATGGAGYQYPGFTVEGIIAERPVTVTTDDLEQLITKFNTPGSGTRSIMNVHYRIPVRSSRILLNLLGGRSNILFFNNASSTFAVGTPTPEGPWFLNGCSSSTCKGPAQYDFQGFTLEDGHYNGQVLHLTILGCHTQNQGPLVCNLPPQSGGVAVSFSSAACQRTDNICMSSEPFDTPHTASDVGWPLESGSGAQYGSGPGAGGRPYPLPYSWDVTTIGTTWNLTTQQAIQNRLSKWTNIATAVFDEPSGTGFGAFRISGYRSISFIWQFDGTSGTSGCWFEIGRSHLVERQSRSWDTSTSGGGSTPPPVGRPPVTFTPPVVPAPVSPTPVGRTVGFVPAV
jgi:hypothetical protein